MNLKALSLCLGGNNESTQQQLFSHQISSIFTVLQFKVSHLFLNFCFTASNNVCVHVHECVHVCAHVLEVSFLNRLLMAGGSL